MLDVHPPHAPAHTWRDFFIHIATICVGLLIAIALEQSVEALHHRRERSELYEQMRMEAERNLLVERETIRNVADTHRSLQLMHFALAFGKVSGDTVEVAPLPPAADKPGPGLIISPSRGTWTAAQAGGIVALLPPEQVKIYARLDYNAEEEVHAEDALVDRLGLLISEKDRAAYDSTQTTPSRITVAHRDDLLFRIGQAENAAENMVFRLAIMQGADEAISHGVHSLDEMYPYQKRVLHDIDLRYALGSFSDANAKSPTPNK
jgi:hypothetical protein